MDHSIDTFERCGVDLAFGRIPKDLIRGLRLVTDEPENLVATGAEERDQSPADEATCSRDDDAQGCVETGRGMAGDIDLRAAMAEAEEIVEPVMNPLTRDRVGHAIKGKGIGEAVLEDRRIRASRFKPVFMPP